MPPSLRAPDGAREAAVRSGQARVQVSDLYGRRLMAAIQRNPKLSVSDAARKDFEQREILLICHREIRNLARCRPD